MPETAEKTGALPNSDRRQLRELLPRIMSDSMRDFKTLDVAPGVAWMKLKLIGWKCLTIPILGYVYGTVNSEGFRFVPSLNKKLHTLPGLDFLYDLEGWHKADLALVCAISLLFFVCYCLPKLLRIQLMKNPELYDEAWKSKSVETFLVIVGTIIVLCDAAIFYAGLTKITWGSSGFSFYALFITGAFGTGLFIYAFVTVCLQDELSKLKKGKVCHERV